MQPLIGITSDTGLNALGQPQARLNDAYVRAVSDAGATVVVIPANTNPDACDTLMARLDGLLLSGGGDIEPWRYAGDNSAPLIDLNRARDELELTLARLAARSAKPFLGICRGCQVVNVALGGSLYEDLPSRYTSTIDHDVADNASPTPAHEVSLQPETLLANLIQDPTTGVNSHHHQGLRNVASSLRVAAIAPDGLVEAVELPEHPFGLAVQWHPERLTRQESSRRLFGAFIAAAARAG